MVSLSCTWNEKMKFNAKTEKHEIAMDAKAPFGSDSAMTPKELLLAGVAGCTAMDVVALLKKFQQKVESLNVQAEATMIETSHPEIFSKILLTFQINGEVTSEKAIEAVQLSQTKYCGVSAMVSNVVPIYYIIKVNGVQIGSGQAQFNLGEE